MSSPPEPRTFEGWIEEDWPGATRRPDVMGVLEPYREAVQYALDDFDDETQSWRDQCGRIYGWGFGPNDEGAVPHAVQKKVSEMMTREPEVEKAPAPSDLDAWRAEAGAVVARAATHRDEPWYWNEIQRLVYANGVDVATPEVRAFIAAARTGWPRDAARVGVLCERVRALEARVATLSALVAAGDRMEALAERFAARCEAWRTYALAVNVLRLSESCVEEEEYARLHEEHDRAWQAVLAVEPEAAKR